MHQVLNVFATAITLGAVEIALILIRTHCCSVWPKYGFSCAVSFLGKQHVLIFSLVVFDVKCDLHSELLHSALLMRIVSPRDHASVIVARSKAHHGSYSQD